VININEIHVNAEKEPEAKQKSPLHMGVKVGLVVSLVVSGFVLSRLLPDLDLKEIVGSITNWWRTLGF